MDGELSRDYVTLEIMKALILQRQEGAVIDDFAGNSIVTRACKMAELMFQNNAKLAKGMRI